jgi:catechol 2,3-dioxygenase-like lactoylglutathione lyase family enzyme
MALSLNVAPAVRFHLSLNVNDLGRSVVFYQTLFNREPAKLRGDYAKFELDDPPLVLSLEPTPRAIGGPLNHLGFRMADPASLVAFQERLEKGGIRSQREAGVECCYAKQTKFWVNDPDGTLWEFYVLEGDLEHRGAGQSLEAMRSEAVPAGAFEHRLGEPVPDALPLADGSIGEVRLRGTFNMKLPAETRRRLIGEAARVLKPGGRLFVHVLVGEKAVDDPGLPGPASYVQHVPVQQEPPALLEAAGFIGLNYLKFDEKPCFVRGGVPMREMQLEARKRS